MRKPQEGEVGPLQAVVAALDKLGWKYDVSPYILTTADGIQVDMTRGTLASLKQCIMKQCQR